MPEPLYNEELILQYIDGELSEEQHLLVKQKIKTDIAWKSAFERLSITTNAIAYYGLAQEVATVHQQLKDHYKLPNIHQAKVISIRRRVRLLTAVAASILLLAAGIAGYQFYQLSPDKVYEQSYVSYQPSVTRGANEENISAIERAYSENDFSKVITASKKVRSLSTEDAFLVGLAYLQMDNALAAIKWLQPLSHGQNILKQDAEFYLALAYIKDADYDLALELMQNIKSDPHHPYHQQFSSKSINEVKMLRWK
jgi:hypothetical protein